MNLKRLITHFTAVLLIAALVVTSALAQKASAAESAAGSYEVLDFLDKIPYWAVYIGLLLLFFLSIEAGFRLGRLKGPSSDALNESRKAQASTILGAMLSLVAFLLAFTFGMAGSQYDTRRRLVVDHANAIGNRHQHDFLHLRWIGGVGYEAHQIACAAVDRLGERDAL